MQLYQTDENEPGEEEVRTATQDGIAFPVRKKWSGWSNSG